MDNNNEAGDYKMPPCPYANYPVAETSMKTAVPAIGDIASYNYMNPIQQQQQKQQFQQTGQQFPGSPPLQSAGNVLPQMGMQQPMVSAAQTGAPMPQIQIPAQQSDMGVVRQSGSGVPQQTGDQATTSGTRIQTGLQPSVVSADSLQYLNGFLRTQIGRPVLVTFLIGTNTLTDRTGTLLGVGINYILIKETRTDDILACDFYNIKFVRFYY